MGGPPKPAITPRVRLILGILFFVLGFASLRLYGADAPRAEVELRGAAMGTTWSVKLATDDTTAQFEAGAVAETSRRLSRVNDLMSTWQANSELSRFNASASVAPFSVAPETAAVFDIALKVSARSAGAFDVTVGPLVDAWGFGAVDVETSPSEAEIAALLSDVGWQKLSLDVESRSLAKADPALRADLSAVAKGYGVDEVVRGLEALGHANFLVEVGGELRAKGAHLDGRPWRVAIEAPRTTGRAIHRIVVLRDLAMATSGDYRNYVERDGERFSHTIDPRTGRPIVHKLASVTVLHSQAAYADAWATALNVLGSDAGYELAAAEHLAAYFIVRAGDSFEVRMTPEFAPFLEPEAAAEK